jgi:hypothetical protein
MRSKTIRIQQAHVTANVAMKKTRRDPRVSALPVNAAGEAGLETEGVAI